MVGRQAPQVGRAHNGGAVADGLHIHIERGHQIAQQIGQVAVPLVCEFGAGNDIHRGQGVLRGAGLGAGAYDGNFLNGAGRLRRCRKRRQSRQQAHSQANKEGK